MSFIKKSHTRRSDDTMDDDSDDKDSKRKSRNLSEKKRRDQFKLLVNELSSMVATAGRKMDKSTVLKSTISFLKNHNEVTVRSRVNEIQEDWKPTFLTNEEFTHLALEAVDGFIIVFSTCGQIFYASESIMSLLGHLPNEVLNMTIYEMASDEEQTNLYNILLRPSEDDRQISFTCHIKRGGHESNQPISYELVNFLGYFRSDEDMLQGENRYRGYSGEGDTRLVFVGTGRIQTPQLIGEMAVVDSSKSEFISRHSLEWKFLFLDHRAPPIIGYLPFELLGTSGYEYYHIDDLDKVIKCHESLMQKGEGTSCYYRFLTKGQQWIWLQTRFYITYHQWNSKPEFIVCTHRVVSYVDVMKYNRKMEEHDISNEPSPSIPWTTKSNKSMSRHGPASDCTSMSPDSPGSRHSAMTQHSTTNQKVHTQPNQHQQHEQLVQQQQQQQQHPVHHQQFLEPPQYVAAISMQPMIATFPTPTVLSPLPVSENIMMPAQAQLQVDLQRKHAELQAIIGQQQAELRRVSEQLIMARLGIIAQPSTHQNPNINVSMSYTRTNSGTVSSTTNVTGIPQTVSPVIIPATIPVSLPLSLPQHHHSLVFNSPDSNTQTK